MTYMVRLPDPNPDQAKADEQAAALNRIAAALERLADVYLYCNDPEPEGEQSQGLGGSLSDVPSRAGWEAHGGD